MASTAWRRAPAWRVRKPSSNRRPPPPPRTQIVLAAHGCNRYLGLQLEEILDNVVIRRDPVAARRRHFGCLPNAQYRTRRARRSISRIPAHQLPWARRQCPSTTRDSYSIRLHLAAATGAARLGHMGCGSFVARREYDGRDGVGVGPTDLGCTYRYPAAGGRGWRLLVEGCRRRCFGDLHDGLGSDVTVSARRVGKQTNEKGWGRAKESATRQPTAPVQGRGAARAVTT